MLSPSAQQVDSPTFKNMNLSSMELKPKLHLVHCHTFLGLCLNDRPHQATDSKLTQTTFQNLVAFTPNNPEPK